MLERLRIHQLSLAHVLVWAALSGSLLYWLRWGSELVAITSYYRIRRSVPSIWNAFHDELPDVGNARAMDLIYWASIATMVVGVLALLWLALAPDPAESANEEPRTTAE